MKKKLLSVLLALTMCLSLLPVTALAAGQALTVTQNGVELRADSAGSLAAREYRIRDDNAVITVAGSTSNSRIVVAGNNVTINLNAVSILLNDCNGSPIEIAANKTATIVLSGENQMTAFAAGPGILVNQGATLTIQGSSDASLTVYGAKQDAMYDGGDASAAPACGYAGIGGPNHSYDGPFDYTGTIRIESGIINAYGFDYGAGIGGGDYSSGGNIEILGGQVTAINAPVDIYDWTAKSASGIGGSQGMHSGKITISGDTTVVNAQGSYACAGIGGSQSDITITNGATVTARGGESAAGIGGYDQNKGASNIAITGAAKVTAFGGENASGIGQGKNSRAVFNLLFSEDSEILAYSDGVKAAITGTPQENSASIINLYSSSLTSFADDSYLILDDNNSTLNRIALASGYKGVGTICSAGTYTVMAPNGNSNDSHYLLIPASGNSFCVTAASDAAAYAGTKVKQLLVSDDGTTIQLDPPSGKVIQSGDDTPLQFDEDTGTIIVPVGGLVDGETWPAGGTVAKDGTAEKTVIDVASITLDKDALTLYTNRDPKTATLTATVSPDNATDKTVTWISADEKIATVENGVVTAVGNGTTTITAQTGEKTATCVVTVRTYSSGGGSSSPSYSVTTPSKTENGTVTVSPRSAEKGDTVTITVKPDSGYQLDDLTVTDKNGNELNLTDKGNGKYTFTMPASKVEINATFVKEVETSPFSDVSTDAYYYEAVKWAQEKGITGGIGNGLFGPNQPCTRAQIVTFLWRAAGSPEPKGMSSFSDVSADSYYAKAVAWAVENGITTGTGDGKFSPDATCTRAQSVTFLFRAIGKLVDSKAEFSDVLTDSYYANAVAWAVENGVTNGIGDGLFGPDNSCTRAQIVTFLYRAYQGK